MTARGTIALLLSGLGGRNYWESLYFSALADGGHHFHNRFHHSRVAAFILVLKISRYPGFKEFLDK